MQEIKLQVPQSYLSFLNTFENWVRAEIKSHHEILNGSDWAFPGLEYLRRNVEIIGANDRPWFKILTSYFEVSTSMGRARIKNGEAKLTEIL